MKKAYVKPKITVEDFQLDAPIAANCEADFDDVRSLQELGFFSDSCPKGIPELQLGDTICYHSNIQTAFLS